MSGTAFDERVQNCSCFAKSNVDLRRRGGRLGGRREGGEGGRGKGREGGGRGGRL